MVGKPSEIGYQIICKEHSIVDKTKVLMIGDNLETDIEFGVCSGFDTIVVLTGVTNNQ
jgi:ribonucleotide monophosphatase NagD (HAD superfamily)